MAKYAVAQVGSIAQDLAPVLEAGLGWAATPQRDICYELYYESVQHISTISPHEAVASQVQRLVGDPSEFYFEDMLQSDALFDELASAVMASGGSRFTGFEEARYWQNLVVVEMDGEGWASQYYFGDHDNVIVGTGVRHPQFNASYDHYNQQLSLTTPWARMRVLTLDRLCQPFPFGRQSLLSAIEELVERSSATRVDEGRITYRISSDLNGAPSPPFREGAWVAISRAHGSCSLMRTPVALGGDRVHLAEFDIDPETGIPLRGFCYSLNARHLNVARWTIISTSRFSGKRKMSLPAGTAVFDFRDEQAKYLGTISDISDPEVQRTFTAGRATRSGLLQAHTLATREDAQPDKMGANDRPAESAHAATRGSPPATKSSTAGLGPAVAFIAGFAVLVLIASVARRKRAR